jgi:arylformamidase
MIYDISPLISERIGVFPGDTKFARNIAMSFAKGDNLELSSFQTTVHIGAHTDAPSHYRKDLDGIDQRSLAIYMGRAQVIKVNVGRGERILPKHIDGKKISAPRVLFHTGTFPDHEKWNSDFAALSPELIVLLANKGVKLVGIDTPSIDPENSKALESHQAVADNDMAILEGIILTNVPEADYTLVALPLKIEGADASPVRAVLLKNLEVLKN